MTRRTTQHRLVVSTWGFFVLYALTSVGPSGVTAQNITSSSSTYPGCSGYVPYMNDSVCDELNNNAECGYDGGDCCSCTCVDSLTKSCGYDADFNCTDPNVPDDCGETPSPAAAFGFPNCTGYMWYLGNEICNDDLNNEECGYDGGDCCRCTCRSTGYDYCGYYGYDCLDPDAPTDCESASPTPSPAAALGYPDCTGYMYNLQNGYCNSDLNNEECGHDGGDCCSCTCEDGTYTCGTNGYDCLDPDANCPTSSPTPSPAAGLGYPDCTGDMSDLQNGYCDSDLNNEECGYDGGDCCRCTCEDGIYYDCGTYDFDCEDPTAPTDCPTPSPTPSPAAAFGYPDCTGYMSDLQNGYCDSDLNNEDCGYDGGDCCSCTCEDGIYYDCGEYGFDCEDPTAPTDCPTPSPTPSPAAGLGYPDCTGDMSDLQDGKCDWDLNNEDCGYDGGDCCSCTCEDGTYECGLYGFDCEDPTAPSYCPTTGAIYLDCTGDMSDFQNGYCDWDLNKEDCGYDGGDCCECSCTGNNGDYECGEHGYTCLDPDPCPSTEKSSEGTIPMGAIIFIACLCAVCAGCFVVGCIRMKRRARMVAAVAAAPLAPLSPPPAYWTTLRAQQWVQNGTTNNPAGQQPIIAQSVGPADPSHQIHVVNPQSTAAQSGQQPRAVMPWGRRAPPGHSYAVTGPRAYPQPSAPPVPPQPHSTDPITRGVISARVTTFRSAPVLEGSVLEGSTTTVAAGDNPNVPDADAIEAERIRLAVAESRRVQTISEAIVRQEICQSQSDAFTAVVTGSGSSPSGITNGSNVEEKDPSNADEKYNDQDGRSGSELGSDGEGRVEEEGRQDDDELGAEGHHQPGTGEVGGDVDRREEIIGSIETDGVSPSDITNCGNVKEGDPINAGKKDNDPSDVTNCGNVEEGVPSNAGKKDNDRDASSKSEWGRDEEDGTEEVAQDDDELDVGVDQLTGLGEVGGDADGQAEIIRPKGTVEEEGREDCDNTLHGDVQAESSKKKGKEELASGDTHQA